MYVALKHKQKKQILGKLKVEHSGLWASLGVAEKSRCKTEDAPLPKGLLMGLSCYRSYDTMRPAKYLMREFCPPSLKE